MTGAIQSSALCCAVTFGTFLGLNQASAAVILSFSNTDSFDNDGVGDEAGPFIDAATGVTGTITTTSLPLGALLNTTSGQIGINSGANGNAFDPGESWGFIWDLDSTFQQIDFTLFSTATESFEIRSSAWIGQAFSPTDSDITFNDGAGAFNFGSGHSSDNFDLQDLNNGNAIPLSAGSEVVFTFAGAALDHAGIATMTFGLSATTVPEPSTLPILAGVGLLAGVYRRARRKPATP